MAVSEKTKLNNQLNKSKEDLKSVEEKIKVLDRDEKVDRVPTEKMDRLRRKGRKKLKQLLIALLMIALACLLLWAIAPTAGVAIAQLGGVVAGVFTLGHTAYNMNDYLKWHTAWIQNRDAKSYEDKKKGYENEKKDIEEEINNLESKLKKLPEEKSEEKPEEKQIEKPMENLINNPSIDKDIHQNNNNLIQNENDMNNISDISFDNNKGAMIDDDNNINNDNNNINNDNNNQNKNHNVVMNHNQLMDDVLHNGNSNHRRNSVSSSKPIAGNSQSNNTVKVPKLASAH